MAHHVTLLSPLLPMYRSYFLLDTGDVIFGHLLNTPLFAFFVGGQSHSYTWVNISWHNIHWNISFFLRGWEEQTWGWCWKHQLIVVGGNMTHPVWASCLQISLSASVAWLACQSTPTAAPYPDDWALTWPSNEWCLYTNTQKHTHLQRQCCKVHCAQ